MAKIYAESVAHTSAIPTIHNALTGERAITPNCVGLSCSGLSPEWGSLLHLAEKEGEGKVCLRLQGKESKGKQVSEISTKEYGTIVFALEEYAQVLEKEGSYQTRNYVYELIWKLQEKAE